MRLSLVKSDGCGLGSDMFCAGQLCGETSAPLGEEKGRFARDEGLRWLVKSQVRDRRMAEGRNAM